MNWRTLKYDLLQLKGDPMLVLSLMVPFILWVIMQFIFPLVAGFALSQWNFDIGSYYQMAGVFFMMLIPMMFGMVYGFILLDERDGGIITAVSVTPMGKTGYLKLRMGIPLFLSIGFLILFQFLLGLTVNLTIFQIIIVSFIIASQALLLLLILGAFAHNKVEGMAISKGFGLLLLGPLLDYILPCSYKWLGAYSPLFWVSRSIISEGIASFTLYILISFIFHSILLFILFRRFIRRID